MQQEALICWQLHSVTRTSHLYYNESTPYPCEWVTQPCWIASCSHHHMSILHLFNLKPPLLIYCASSPYFIHHIIILLLCLCAPNKKITWIVKRCFLVLSSYAITLLLYYIMEMAWIGYPNYTWQEKCN